LCRVGCKTLTQSVSESFLLIHHWTATAEGTVIAALVLALWCDFDKQHSVGVV